MAKTSDRTKVENRYALVICGACGDGLELRGTTPRTGDSGRTVERNVCLPVQTFCTPCLDKSSNKPEIPESTLDMNSVVDKMMYRDTFVCESIYVGIRSISRMINDKTEIKSVYIKVDKKTHEIVAVIRYPYAVGRLIRDLYAFL